jgi:Glyoxalase-like domain
MISRRVFLALTGSTLLAPQLAWPAEDEVLPMLDHILLGSRDLDRGIAFVEERTGVRAAVGGVHPGRGTRNALISLGERRYLEIIALDPAQNKVPEFAAPLFNLLKSLSTSRVVGWAAHPGDIEALAKRLRESRIAIDGPRAGSRARPDGRLLQWKTVTLADDHDGVLPFFIEWDAGSVHPSTDAPAGCRLERFAIADPDPRGLEKTCKQLGLEVPIEHGDKPQLRARIVGPKGKFEVSS